MSNHPFDAVFADLFAPVKSPGECMPANLTEIVAHNSEIAVASAEINRDTITRMRAAHDAEVAELWKRIRAAEESRRLAVKRGLELDAILSDMQDELVFVGGRWISLMDAHEQGLFRSYCPGGCRDAQCEGCVSRTDGSLDAEAQAREIEAWQAGWLAKGLRL